MRSILLVLFLSLSALLSGQYNSFINIGIEDGLAQSQVNDVHQDASGYLWIATVSGLSRFDGTEIKNYYKSDGLVDNMVTCIIEKEDGSIYFGGLGGFSSFSAGVFKSHPFPKSLIDSRVQCMQFANDSTLWLATNRDGYFSYSFVKEAFTVPLLGLGRNIRWLDINLGLIASSEGLFDHGKIISPDLEGISITDVIAVQDELWVSTLGEGLYHFDGKWNVIVEDSIPEISFIRDMHFSSKGELWLVGPEGAVKKEKDKWRVFDESNGLDYMNLRHVDEDKEGNLWFSSNGQGLFRYTGELFTSYRKGQPLRSELMLSASEREGKLYLGMFDDSLQVLFQDGTVELDQSLFITDVWAQLVDSQNRIWAGTSSGLFRSDLGSGFERILEEELPHHRITALFEDGFGNIWIGHREGVSVCYSDTEVFNYNEESGFDGKRIRAIEQTQDGAIWLGAQNGLFRIEDDWILHLDESNGLNDNTIYSIQDDKLGRLWVGAKNGLHILKDDSILQVLLSGRVDANNINFLHASDKGYLYVGTNQGFFSAEALDSIGEMEFRQYGIADGLPGLECNLNAVFQSETGEIWFGTNRGVVRFNEDELIRSPALKEPYLTMNDILLFAESFDIKARSDGFDAKKAIPEGLTFAPSENHVTFSFNGIRLKDPNGIRYQYYLEGLDSDWLPSSSSRSVTYSSLPFGEFTFKVRCVDASGQQLGESLALPFKIKAPVLLRWWALVLESLLLIGLVFLTVRWRKQVRQRKDRMVELGYRNRMQSLEQASLNSSMNRHFIFNSLNAIQFYINREDKRAANKYLSSFAKLIRKNLDSTATAWVSLQDELDRLELYLSLEHMRFKDKFRFSIEVEEGMDASTVQVPAMMLQPFVENSIWHGILPKEESGKVEVKVDKLEGRLRIRIEDDGIGIDASRASKNGSLPDHESKGMDITHHRLRLYGEMTGTAFDVVGPVQIEENDTILGTRIDLFIPLV